MENSGWLYLCFTIIIMLGGFFIRKNKIYFIFQLVWMQIIMGLNTYSMDWESNEQVFQSANTSSNKGIFLNLYNSLAVMFKNNGWDYITFNFILCAISVTIIGYIIYDLCSNPCVAVSFMYIYPFLDNVIQKRAFYALGFISLAFYLYYKINSKLWKNIIFFFLILLACQFHVLSILAFSFIIYEGIPFKARKYFISFTILVGLVFRNKFGNIIDSLDNQALTEKSNLYFNQLAQKSSLGHFIFWVCWQTFFLIIIYYIVKKLKINNRFSNYVLDINVWILILIPFYTFDPVFSRLFRAVMLFNFILVSNNIYINKMKIRVGSLIIFIEQLLLNCISLYVFILNSPFGFNYMILDIFKYNLLLK